MVLAESIDPTISKYILPASRDVQVGNHGQIDRVAVGNQICKFKQKGGAIVPPQRVVQNDIKAHGK